MVVGYVGTNIITRDARVSLVLWQICGLGKFYWFDARDNLDAGGSSLTPKHIQSLSK